MPENKQITEPTPEKPVIVSHPDWMGDCGKPCYDCEELDCCPLHGLK